MHAAMLHNILTDLDLKMCLLTSSFQGERGEIVLFEHKRLRNEGQRGHRRNSMRFKQWVDVCAWGGTGAVCRSELMTIVRQGSVHFMPSLLLQYFNVNLGHKRVNNRLCSSCRIAQLFSSFYSFPLTNLRLLLVMVARDQVGNSTGPQCGEEGASVIGHFGLLPKHHLERNDTRSPPWVLVKVITVFIY